MNDERMKLTLKDMKELIPEWEGTTYMETSSPEIAPENKGPILKITKTKRVTSNE